MIKTKHTFFCEDIDIGQLSEEESHHAFKVLRLKINDQITVIDGKGYSVTAEIIEISKKSLSFNIIDKTELTEVLPQIHIAIAPTKNIDRFEFFLEKVTELGITEITPLLCSNSERKIIKDDRLKKIVLAATKQSGNLFLPKLNELTSFKTFIESETNVENNFIAHCENDESKNDLKQYVKNLDKICILIGPEGDFTKEEIILAQQKKFKPVSLGHTRLRTETAGIIACHTVKIGQ
jgi:16S rRNA (uracil1498-N3)-methyltransferase